MFIKKLIFTIFVASGLLNASTITKEECEKQGESYIFAGGECINFKKYNGETKGKLNIVVHGKWDEKTNTLGRYAPFAENLSFETDINTVAIALPGYSNSSTNNIKSLSSGENLAFTKEYVELLSSLVSQLKTKYNANIVTYIGHSAGCTMGINLVGEKPFLINNLLCAGGSYKLDEKNKSKDKISAMDVIDNIDRRTKIVLVYGSEDKISTPKQTKDFYEFAKKEGLDVKLVEATGSQHLDLDMTEASVNAIVELVE
ncbi:hypothetical protein B0F89_104105 [Malaciobacter marinus]|uniref:Alpha/beta hydrolase n=1 Tax=Malaciobacter marinus TaxID=505249 RepID=A0AB36ZY25_9BACT|nr:alpha/beta hydrolase [Malaciobacter marinus]PPK62334.1 hypothetical protein B0F89_104105 [Malaciobacter marinus]